ncbi:MAG: EpsG family protein [Flavobacteriaceae bacterium]|nr:EpsG family protein [Flavobacteriaceae bacterium]
MYYLLFLLINCLVFNELENYKGGGKYFKIGCIAFFVLSWTLMIGSQLNVGSDYYSYLGTFRDGTNMRYLLYSKSYLFVYFVKFMWLLGIKGQGIYFVIALIEALIFLKIMTEVFGYKKFYTVLFVFICFSTVFNNQMNGIRQYIAVYMVTLSTIYFLKKKYIYWGLLFFSSIFFHKSAMFLLPLFAVLFFLKDKVMNYKLQIAIIVLGVILANVDFMGLLKQILVPLGYRHYLYNGRLYEIAFQSKIVELFFAPFFIYVVYKFGTLKKLKLSDLERNLFNIGVIGFIIKLATLSLNVLNRFNSYFEIFMIFPFVFFLMKAKGKKNNEVKTLLWLAMLGIYILKVTYFAVREYSYNSIFF